MKLIGESCCRRQRASLKLKLWSTRRVCFMRGTLGGAEHRNTAENIDKYRNTAKKSANIAIPHRKSMKYRNRKNVVYYSHYALQQTRIAWFRI